MRNIVIGILSLFFLTSTSVAYANHHGAENPCAHNPCSMKGYHGGHHGYGMMGGYGHYDKEALVKTLGLNDDQKTKVKDIWNKTIEQVKANAKQIREAGANIGKALSEAKPDFAKARGASEVVIDLKKTIKMLYLDATEATYKVLTDAQKAKWPEAMKAFHDSQYGHGMMNMHHGMKGKKNCKTAKKDCPLKGTKECPNKKKK